MDNIFREANQKLNIQSVVEKFTGVSFDGNNQCCCPFHNDSTPSFTIYPDTNSFHCFGCGVSGDCVGFVAKFNGIPMVDALKLLDEGAASYSTIKTTSCTKKKNIKTASEIKSYIEKCKTAIGKTDYFIKRGLTPKRSKKAILEAIEETRKQSQNQVWNKVTNSIYPLLLAGHTDVFAHFFCNNGFFITLIENKTGTPFITGDQPVVNTKNDYATNIAAVDFELYYPVSPSLAVLCSNKIDTNSRMTITDTSEVEMYNQRIHKAAIDEIYSSDQNTLNAFKS